MYLEIFTRAKQISRKKISTLLNISVIRKNKTLKRKTSPCFEHLYPNVPNIYAIMYIVRKNKSLNWKTSSCSNIAIQNVVSRIVHYNHIWSYSIKHLKWKRSEAARHETAGKLTFWKKFSWNSRIVFFIYNFHCVEMEWVEFL